jgi:hypothetical protein
MFSQHEMYVATLNRWYHLESMPMALHGVTGGAFANGWIHVPGGSSSSNIHQVFSWGGLVR